MPASTRLAALVTACLLLHSADALGQSTSLTSGLPEGTDPSDTRLVLMPTARTLPAGQSSLTLLGCVLPLAQFGLTDRMSIGAGTLAPVAVPVHPIILLAKMQVYDDDRTQAAAGIVHATNLGSASIGMAYGVVTRGTAQDAWTAGAAWVYAHDRAGSGGTPMVFFGGEHRMTAHQKTIVDVLVRPDFALANVGVRVIHNQFAADFAAMVVVGQPTPGATVTLAWRF